MALVEPEEPQPEAFGLSSKRLSEYEDYGVWLFTRLLAAGTLIAFAFMALKFLASRPVIHSFIDLFMLLILGGIGVMMSFSFSFMAAFPCSFIVDALWKRLQHDYAGFKAYERAVQQYKLLRAEWLKTQRSWWDELHPQRFEQEVALFFKSQGYRVEWTGRSGDGGVDIKVTNQEGKKIVVQCKAHQKPVPPGAVRELFGTLLHEKADEGWLMSRSGFTVGAAKFATGKPIRLLDLNHVILGRGI